MNIDIDIESLSKDEFSAYRLIDIREPHEYETMPAATNQVEYIPFAEFPNNILAFNSKDQYLLFCAVGGRSHHMAAYLAQEGIHALSVINGISAVNMYLQKNANAR